MNKFLLAVDNSPATWKAVDYVEDCLNKHGEIAVHVFHALDPLPPALQESRGAEHPRDEAKLEAELRREQNAWREKVKMAAEPVVKQVLLKLEQSGTKPEKISSEFSALAHREDLPDEILKAAQEAGCDTIVVGRNSFPWVKEIFADHLGEELEKNSQGISVAVID
jgi:nucleotide-binding universal stress UspA family protein